MAYVERQDLNYAEMEIIIGCFELKKGKTRGRSKVLRGIRRERNNRKVLAARISPETTGATTIPRKIYPLRQPRWLSRSRPRLLLINTKDYILEPLPLFRGLEFGNKTFHFDCSINLSRCGIERAGCYGEWWLRPLPQDLFSPQVQPLVISVRETALALLSYLAKTYSLSAASVIFK